MTKEGRFVRVHFKSGLAVKLVPAGSLASGVQLSRDGTTYSVQAVTPLLSPGVEKLLAEFRAGPKRKHRKKVAG
jgi:hypothetical protein